jgi:hypothetical protein
MQWPTKKSKRGGRCREPRKPAGVSALAALRKLIEKLFAIGLWLTTSKHHFLPPCITTRARNTIHNCYPRSKGMSLE